MRKYLLYAGIVCSLGSCETSSSGLHGAWSLKADQMVDVSGKVVEEDTHVDGRLVYSPNGYMSVQLVWWSKREPLMSDTVMRADGISSGVGLGTNSWSAEQNRAWMDSYDAYFGTYQVDEANHIVTHIVQGNLRPEKIGTEYRRVFTLKSDTLFLRSVNPKDRWQTLWVREP